MMTNASKPILVLVLSVLLTVALAERRSLSAQERPESLARAYVEAVNQSSREMVTRLIHPDCPVGLVDWDAVDRSLEMTVPDEYALQVVDLTPDNDIFSLASPAVEASTLLFMSFENADGVQETLMNFTAEKDGRWYLVLCRQEAAANVTAKATEKATEQAAETSRTATAAPTPEKKEKPKATLRHLPKLSGEEIERELTWRDEIAFFLEEQERSVDLRIKTLPLPNWAVVKVNLIVDSVMTLDGRELLDRQDERAASYRGSGMALGHVVEPLGLDESIRVYTVPVEAGEIHRIEGRLRIKIPTEVKSYSFTLQRENIAYVLKISGSKVTCGTNDRRSVWVKWPEELYDRSDFQAYDENGALLPRGGYTLFRPEPTSPVSLSRSYDGALVSQIEILEGDNFIEKTIPFTAYRHMAE